MKTFRALPTVLALSSVLFVGCANLNDPYGSGGYGSGGYGSGGYGGYGAPYGGYNQPPPYYGSPGYYNNYPNYQQQQRDLERERRRLEEERIRLERERDAYQAPPSRPAPRPVQDRCPAGFSPSENKCSPQERRNGCRDIRLPSGLGCVSR